MGQHPEFVNTHYRAYAAIDSRSMGVTVPALICIKCVKQAFGQLSASLWRWGTAHGRHYGYALLVRA